VPGIARIGLRPPALEAVGKQCAGGIDGIRRRAEPYAEGYAGLVTGLRGLEKALEGPSRVQASAWGGAPAGYFSAHCSTSALVASLAPGTQ